MPHVAEVAPVGLKLGPINDPRDLRRLLRFGLGAVPLLRGPLLGEVRSHATKWAGRNDATTTGFHPSTVPAAVVSYA